MEVIKHYKIRYKQKFQGEILEDTFDKWCTPYELENTISWLYEDPHVISVEYMEISILGSKKSEVIGVLQ